MCNYFPYYQIIHLIRLFNSRKEVSGRIIFAGRFGFTTLLARSQLPQRRAFLLYMAKELPFFKFEISEWMFGRIQKQPLEVQGTFINLCCRYWHKLGDLSYDNACFDFVPEHIDNLIKSGIVKKDGERVVIAFMDSQLDECASISKVNSVKGKKSAEIRANRKSTAVNHSSTPVQHRLTTVEPNSTGVQPDSTEEKRREVYIGEQSDLSIAIPAKYANDRPVRIYSLHEYFASRGQSESFEIKGWTHYRPFMQANPGRVFNDHDHLYNSYRQFCESFVAPVKTSEYDHAEYNKSLWTKEAWEEFYAPRLKSDNKFRKHFGYAELQNGTPVGGRNNGRGGAKGGPGP